MWNLNNFLMFAAPIIFPLSFPVGQFFKTLKAKVSNVSIFVLRAAVNHRVGPPEREGTRVEGSFKEGRWLS